MPIWWRMAFALATLSAFRSVAKRSFCVWKSAATSASVQMVTRMVRNGYTLPRAVTIRAYSTGIPAWYDCPISTGKVEGINHKIKVMRRVPYGFSDERYFRLRLYALHDCRITPHVGWAFFCVFETYCSLCFQICIMSVLRGGFARAYTRASGGFCFLPSPLHPYALSCWARERKGWRLLSFSLHTLFTHSGGTVKVRRDLSLHPKMVEIVCVVDGRWRVKAKSRNSVSAYARVSGAKASP